MKPFTKIAGLIDPRRPVSLAAMGWLAVAIVVFDQATKLAAVGWLKGAGPVVIVPGVFNLLYQENPGAAFSMFYGKTLLLLLVSTSISIGIGVWAVRLPPAEQGMRPALGLILGGAVGNLIDRARLGVVIDFLDAHWFWKAHWPTFNIADSAVCIGMGLMIVASFRLPPRAEETGDRSDAKRPAGSAKRR
jgi:signal peptidase II